MTTTKRKNHSSSKPNPDKPSVPGYARFISIAIEVVAINLLFIWGGIALDDRYPGFSPLFIIVGVVFATAATIYYLLTRLNRK